MISVVRIESRSANLPAVADVSRKIFQLIGSRSVRALQLDFDAHRSEQAYYRRLLEALHRNIPAKITLEMTALVSWCTGDDWLRGLPIADAVPMFFRMGIDPRSTAERLSEPLCGSSIGISTGEFYINVPPHRRVYVFNDQLWTESSYQAVLRASKRWLAE